MAADPVIQFPVFVAHLMHELRQPLAVVALGVDTAKVELEQGQTERALRRLDGIAATLERLSLRLSDLQNTSQDAPRPSGDRPLPEGGIVPADAAARSCAEAPVAAGRTAPPPSA